MKLNEREKELLNKILNDKYSVGSFCGMCTNLTLANQVEGKEILTPETVIQKALQIRIIAEDMAKDDKSVMNGQGPNDTPKEDKDLNDL